VENNPTNICIFPTNICFFASWYYADGFCGCLIQMLPGVRWVGFLPPQYFANLQGILDHNSGLTQSTYQILINQVSCTLAKFVGKNVGDSDRLFTCLGHLGWCNTDRIISISVTWPRQVRKMISCRDIADTFVCTNFSNVNAPSNILNSILLYYSKDQGAYSHHFILFIT
jgi:hypothetical protein